MKKILSFICFVLLSSPSFAGVISVDTFSADSGVAHLESLRTTVVDEINGRLEGSASGSTVNILADSLGELDMGDNINPRLRANELLGIGVDTTSSSTSVVTSGLTPATSANLTSNISTGTAYINGYRVNKAATQKTYTASKDTYVDLDQDGNFTYSEVSVGASAPSVAANSARLALVTTDGTQITSVSDLANRRIPNLVIPTNFRDGLLVSRDSATTMNVTPGVAEVNNAVVSKTADTTLTLTTAGDWAGGSSLQAVSTFGYVGIDSSGDIKMHTTAPTHQNYGVTIVDGTLRYATWSSTVYRILGWFYMNSTGSGELDTYGVSNIREQGAWNKVGRTGITQDTINDTSYGTDLTQSSVPFYSTGRPSTIFYNASLSQTGSAATTSLTVDVDGTDYQDSEVFVETSNVEARSGDVAIIYPITLGQGSHTITIQGMVNANSSNVNRKKMIVIED